MDACGLRFRGPGPPISCPGRPICGQSQICAEAHVLGDTRTPVASGLSAGRPFPAFTSVAALPPRGQGLHYFCERSTGDVAALHRTLSDPTRDGISKTTIVPNENTAPKKSYCGLGAFRGIPID